MREPLRISAGRQYWLSPPQILALGIITVSLVMLAFFLGLMLGRSGASAGAEVMAEAGASGLVDADVQDDTITELLSKVEQAASRRSAHAAEFSFPEELVASRPTLQVPQAKKVELDAVVVVAPDPGPAPSPVPVEEVAPERPLAPTQGWAIQVASYTTITEADGRVNQLVGDGHEAWHVQAFVKGMNRFRVRVGPFSSEEEALEARGALRMELPEQDLMVTRNE